MIGETMPCERHGDGTLVVSCRACRVWWELREARKDAEYWRERWRRERGRRLELQGRMGT